MPNSVWGRIRIPVRLTALAVVVILSGPPAGWAEVQPPVSASNPGGSWIDTLLEPLSDLSHWISRLFSRDEVLVTDEIKRFKTTLDHDVTPLDGLVRQAGFTLAAFSVGASLESPINLSLSFRRRLSEPEKTVLMAKITDAAKPTGTVERSIVMILLNAAESSYVVRNDGYRLSQVGIELDTVPKVTLTMTPVSLWP